MPHVVEQWQELAGVGQETLDEVARIEAAGIVSGISMALINAKVAQEDAVQDRKAEYAKGGSF